MKIYTLLVLIFFGACTSSHSIISKTGVEEIKFGSGGGVTGAQTTYTLKADTRLYKNDTFLRKVDTQKTEDLFKKAKTLVDKKLKQPGNLYSFIQIKTSTKTNRLVWQSGKKLTQKDITELFNALQLIAKDS